MSLQAKPSRMIASCLIVLALFGGAACSEDGSDADDDKTTTTVDDGTTTTAGDDENAPDDTVDGPTTTVTGNDDDDDDENDDAPSGDAQVYITALADSISADGFATKAQGECLGERWVGIVGMDKLVSSGMSPDDFGDLENYSKLALDQDTAAEMYDGFGDCGIDVVKSLTATFNDDGQLTAAELKCVEGIVTPEAVRKLFVNGSLLGEDGEDALELYGSTSVCFEDD